MKAIDLAGFEDKFVGDPDPWRTWSDPDEALKRVAILHALGPATIGRVLEIGAGNGSNSRPLAARALRLDATEATETGAKLVAEAVSGRRGARALRLIVPERPPRAMYDAIVLAEVLYYLHPRAMEQLARQVARILRPGGRLVLAHHRITFYDFVQHADGIHHRFLSTTARPWRCRSFGRTGRWEVMAAVRRDV